MGFNLGWTLEFSVRLFNHGNSQAPFWPLKLETTGGPFQKASQVDLMWNLYYKPLKSITIIYINVILLLIYINFILFILRFILFILRFILYL